MVLHDDNAATDAKGFSQQLCLVARMMKDIDEQHRVKGVIGKGDDFPIELPHRDLRLRLHQDVNALNLKPGIPLDDLPRNSAGAAPDIQDSTRLWKEIGENIRQPV